MISRHHVARQRPPAGETTTQAGLTTYDSNNAARISIVTKASVTRLGGYVPRAEANGAHDRGARAGSLAAVFAARDKCLRLARAPAGRTVSHRRLEVVTLQS